MIKLLGDLLKFGFIATKRELKLLVRPLVRILDSRKGKAAALFDDDDRYKIESTDERLLCEIKQQIIRVLMRVNRTRGTLHAPTRALSPRSLSSAVSSFPAGR